MKILPLLLVLTLAATFWTGNPLDELVRSELAFADRARASGVKEAFLEFLHDDAVMFRPGPVKAKEMWNARESPPIRLAWYPSHAEVAASGDFGWTAGPWTIRDSAGSDDVRAAGHFVTVWRKFSGEGWKVVLDVGVSHAIPEASPPLFDVERSKRVAAVGEPGGIAAAGAPGAEMIFIRLAADSGLVRAYGIATGTNPVFFREGMLPVESRSDAVKRGPRGCGGFVRLGGGESASGDMGYSYGSCAGDSVAGHYVRIWRRTAATWSIVLDLHLPLE